MAVTTKEQFLSQLRIRLFWRVEAAEVNDILSDYEEFFVSGAAEGKSEEQLSKEFGRPATIARNLTAGKPRPVILWRLLLSAGLVVIMTLLCLPLATYERGLLSLTNFSAQRLLLILSGYAILLPIFLWFFLGGSLLHPPGWAFRSIGKANRLSWLPCLLILVCDLLVSLTLVIPLIHVIRTKSDGFLWFGLWFTDWYQIGSVYRVLFPIVGLLFFAGLLFCLFWFSHAYCRIFPCICLLLGSLASLAQSIDLLLELDDPNLLPTFVWVAMFPLACGILLAVVFWLIIRRCAQKGAA